MPLCCSLSITNGSLFGDTDTLEQGPHHGPEGTLSIVESGWWVLDSGGGRLRVWMPKENPPISRACWQLVGHRGDPQWEARNALPLGRGTGEVAHSLKGRGRCELCLEQLLWLSLAPHDTCPISELPLPRLGVAQDCPFSEFVSPSQQPSRRLSRSVQSSRAAGAGTT